MSLQESCGQCGNCLNRAYALLQPFVAVLTRFVIGYAFLQAGMGKFVNMAGTAEFFAGIGIPFPGLNAWFIATLEVVGGAMLILGLGTRLFSALLSATMIVAIGTAHRTEFFDAVTGAGDKGVTDLVPFVFLLFLLWLIAYGPGALSSDKVVCNMWQRARARKS